MNYSNSLHMYQVLDDLTKEAQYADRESLFYLMADANAARAEVETAHAVLMQIIDRIYGEGESIEHVIDELGDVIKEHQQAVDALHAAIDQRKQQILPVITEVSGHDIH